MRFSGMIGISNAYIASSSRYPGTRRHLPEENRTIYWREVATQVQPFTQVHVELSRTLNFRWELGLYGHVSGNYLRRDQYELRIDHQADSRPDAPVVRREWARTRMESGGLGLNLTYRVGLGRRFRQE